MFEPKMREMKRIWIPEEPEQQQQQEKRTIAAPVIDGKRHIGSGEDAYVEALHS